MTAAEAMTTALATATADRTRGGGVLLATRPMLRPVSLLFGLLVAATLLQQGVSAKKRNNGGSRTAATRKKECEQAWPCADALSCAYR